MEAASHALRDWGRMIGAMGEKGMWTALVNSACRWLSVWSERLWGERVPQEHPPLPAPPKTLRPLQRVVLTDQVARTFFDGFAEHRRGDRGDEEIGWVLLGLREETEAIVLATLPAGAQRSAGVAHVRFNSTAQAVASRIVRQWDKRLGILGVTHTHPGSLRHPSDGDFHGDSVWVANLRGREGVFGIGTADVPAGQGSELAQQIDEHRQTLGELCFSWYALAQGERRYRRLPVGLTLGPDLARPLHRLWEILEAHAEVLDRLCRQLAHVRLEVLETEDAPALVLIIPLAEPKCSLRVLLEREGVRYFVQQRGDLSAVDPEDGPVDRCVFLILAELAGRSLLRQTARQRA